MLIHSEDSGLPVIDMQGCLVPAMQAPARTPRNARLLSTAAEARQVPAAPTEQCPQGLAPTVAEIRTPAGDGAVVEKLHFSCTEEEPIACTFAALGRRQAVFVGTEAHVRVVRTTTSLVEAGLEVFVVSDATASRTGESEHACIRRPSASDAATATTETVVSEWLGKAGTPAFETLPPSTKH